MHGGRGCEARGGGARSRQELDAADGWGCGPAAARRRSAAAGGVGDEGPWQVERCRALRRGPRATPRHGPMLRALPVPRLGTAAVCCCDLLCPCALDAPVRLNPPPFFLCTRMLDPHEPSLNKEEQRYSIKQNTSHAGLPPGPLARSAVVAACRQRRERPPCPAVLRAVNHDHGAAYVIPPRQGEPLCPMTSGNGDDGGGSDALHRNMNRWNVRGLDQSNEAGARFLFVSRASHCVDLPPRPAAGHPWPLPVPRPLCCAAVGATRTAARRGWPRGCMRLRPSPSRRRTSLTGS